MRHLSRKDIEAIAEKYVAAYMELPEVRETHVYRIEPELFLEKVLGLRLEYAHLSYDGSVLGMTSFEEVMVDVMDAEYREEHVLLDGRTVLVESELRDDNRLRGRKNFTLMHEGSHQIFKKLFPDDYGMTKGGSSPILCYRISGESTGRITDWEEWQANTLGPAILLPKDLIAKTMELFALGEKIECLNKIYRPQEYERFSAMADFLGSSKKALAIRMKRLGLIGKEYLDNPFDMILV